MKMLLTTKYNVYATIQYTGQASSEDINREVGEYIYQSLVSFLAKQLIKMLESSKYFCELFRNMLPKALGNMLAKPPFKVTVMPLVKFSGASFVNLLPKQLVNILANIVLKMLAKCLGKYNSRNPYHHNSHNCCYYFCQGIGCYVSQSTSENVGIN